MTELANVIGIDLGWLNTGIAWVRRGEGDRVELVAHIHIAEPKHKGLVTDAVQVGRAVALARGLDEFYEAHEFVLPLSVVYERPTWVVAKGRVAQAGRHTSNEAILSVGRAQGVMWGVLSKWGAELHAVDPNEWRRIVGYTPSEYCLDAAERYPRWEPVKRRVAAYHYFVFGEWPETDHESDAAVMAAWWLTRNVEIDV